MTGKFLYFSPVSQKPKSPHLSGIFLRKIIHENLAKKIGVEFWGKEIFHLYLNFSL